MLRLVRKNTNWQFSIEHFVRPPLATERAASLRGEVGPRNFIRAVERRLETAPTLVFNPLTARMAPAIDVRRELRVS